MLKYFYFITLLFIASEANSQVKLLTLNELNHRVSIGKDTTYVINFWATWCGPCVDELPSFEKLQADFKDKPLKVILVSLDFKSKLKNIVLPFVEKNKLKSEVFIINESDQQSFFKKVNQTWSGAIPATLFINTQKNISSFYPNPFATYADLTNLLSSLSLHP